MANLKSAKKRILQNQRRSEVNKARRSKIKNNIKSIYLNFDKKNTVQVKKEFLSLESNLAKAANKGFFKKNTASRMISRIAQKIKVSK